MRPFPIARRLALVAVLSLIATPLLAQTKSSSAPAKSLPPGDPAHPKTVAVLYFDNNTGKTDYDALGRGIAAMLITDLSAVPEIRLVERERLQAVLTEQQMSQSQLFDPATAVRAGKLLGAEYLLIGAFSSVDPNLRIDTRVVRVETGEVVRTAKVQGKEGKFFDLQQRLAQELIDGLPVAVSPEALEALRVQQTEKNRINDQRTLVDLSQGISSLDARDYATAVEKFGSALVRSPDALVARAGYDEAKRRSTASLKEKAKDKARTGLRGLLNKRP
jgi:TolB-like protein